MLKKMALAVFSGFLLLNLCGCFVLLGGAAGGAGTAAWLSGKLTQEVDASYDDSIRAAKSALKSLRLEMTKETREETVDQVMSKYSDGRTIWIDIHKVSETSTKIEVRVGGVPSDKAAASKIMDRILRYL
ncbi:MAG: DUF3568 family protein [Candidatus Omnitrophica bacterium]|nr:DUF3568 family protein [Candidatus Omnitrophota bacterium]